LSLKHQQVKWRRAPVNLMKEIVDLAAMVRLVIEEMRENLPERL
jgi:hypothetical protein